MSDIDAIRVEPAAADEEPPGGGLHWFRVEFDDCEGRCCITMGEAQRLRELSSDWVERALINLAAKYGFEWLRETACSSPGLVLHYMDA